MRAFSKNSFIIKESYLNLYKRQRERHIKIFKYRICNFKEIKPPVRNIPNRIPSIMVLNTRTHSLFKWNRVKSIGYLFIITNLYSKNKKREFKHYRFNDSGRYKFSRRHDILREWG